MRRRRFGISWIVSALPMADPDGHARARGRFTFPPVKGFYEDPEQPESRYVWRWVTYQAPDLVVEFRGDASRGEAPDSLTAALRRSPARRARASPRAASCPRPRPRRAARWRLRAPSSAGRVRRSTRRSRTRIARTPLDIARLLAAALPGRAVDQLHPALAWIKTLELSARTGDAALRTKVMAQVQPWLSGEKSLLGDRIQLTTVAGTMVFAELAKADAATTAARTAGARGRRRGAQGEGRRHPAVRPGMDRRHVHGVGDPRAHRVDAGTRARSRSRRAAAHRLRRPPAAARRHLQPRDRRPRRLGPRQRLRGVRPDGDADGDARRPSVARGAARRSSRSR